MLTAQEKIRAARMFAIVDTLSVMNRYPPLPSMAQHVTELMLRYHAGKCDHFSPIQQAMRVLNRISPDGRVNNAVQALEYLRGYFAAFDTRNPHGERRFTRIGAAWTAGYVVAHGSFWEH